MPLIKRIVQLLKDLIAKLQAAWAPVNTQIQDLQSKLAAAQAQVTSLTASNADLNQQLTDAQAQLTDLLNQMLATNPPPAA